ncbi:polyamine ABC transporter substrate-binding protein [Pseudomonas sp. BGr12]|uniref:polyamine ABC transporter substrate-binding protein n=1 Tax=Pseudomonas sp. BGr12 TaxID=2936269 RepID=UPI002559E7A4|nr:polyamine ABC transporter substrate-binding protein [Pseudomonas sp. BJa5]MDL2426326.1 polyamine ABC transporter substrate-binding protein [Pseudomonas sp. BJa5]
MIMTRALRLLLTIALLVGRAASAGEGQVNIYNWSDYIGETTLADFQSATGIRAFYDIFDSNETLEAKLLAGHSGYDIVVPSSHLISRQIQAGVFAPLDRSLLPNYRNLDPEILKQLAKNDPGNRYAVPYLWGTGGIAYNKDKVRKVLGVDSIDSWSALFDPSVMKKLHQCGVAVMDSPDELYGAAIHYLGRDVSTATLHDYEDATALIKKIRPYISYFHSSKFVSDLANGEICLAMANSGDGVQAIERANEAHNGVHLEYVVPKEGGNVWFDVLTIPADAPHKKEAHAFINFLLDPKNIASVTAYTGYANPTPASQRFLPADIVGNEAVFPSAATVKRLYVAAQPPPQYVRYVTRAWIAVKNGI